MLCTRHPKVYRQLRSSSVTWVLCVCQEEQVRMKDACLQADTARTQMQLNSEALELRWVHLLASATYWLCSTLAFMKVMAWGFDGCVLWLQLLVTLGLQWFIIQTSPNMCAFYQKVLGVCCHIMHLACGATHAQTFIAHHTCLCFCWSVGTTAAEVSAAINHCAADHCRGRSIHNLGCNQIC